MTAEDKVEIKSFIHDALSGYVARVDSQNEITNLKLANIDAHLQKQNGRLGKAEEAIALALQERSANRQKQEDYFSEIDDLDDRLTAVEKKEMAHTLACPQEKRITSLETTRQVGMSLKSFVIGSITLFAVVIGSVYSTIKIVEAHQARKTEIQQPIAPVQTPIKK